MFYLTLRSFSRIGEQFIPLENPNNKSIQQLTEFLNPEHIFTAESEVKITFASSEEFEKVATRVYQEFRTGSADGIYLLPNSLEFHPPTSSSISTSLNIDKMSLYTPDWLVFQTGHTTRIVIERVFRTLEEAIRNRSYGIRSTIEVVCVWDRCVNRVLSEKMSNQQFFGLKQTLQQDGVVVFTGAATSDIVKLFRILRDIRFAQNCYLENLTGISMMNTKVGSVLMCHVPTS